VHTAALTRGSASGLDADGSCPGGRPFFFVLRDLVRRPQQILFLWNWKSALLSVVLRGPIFVIVTLRRGWTDSLLAFCTESVFCVVTAGFYGAIAQTLRDAEPEWLAVLFLTVIMPALFQVLEYVLHRFRGTPHLRVAEMISLVVSALSALFNWYAMRRGTLLVGGEGGRFGDDLRRLPRLLLNFVAALPRGIGRTKTLNFSHRAVCPDQLDDSACH
jgi:hypothetical protein